MKNRLFSAACLGGSLLLGATAWASAGFTPQRVSATDHLTVSKGHNLSDRRQAQQEGKAVKTLPSARSQAPAKAKGLSVSPRHSARIIDQETSAILFESFEACEHLSDVTPEGWTSESKGQTPMGTEDHWIGFSKAYADYNMFAPPAHGKMMMGIFYNDDEYKDEWLVSPQISIPSDGYELSFYWYTLPYYMYVIDRFHVDFDSKVFIDRELTFDVEVMVKADGEEWQRLFHLEQLFADLEYSDLEYLDYAEMQKQVLNLDAYAGKDVQLAFRYAGKEGNSFYLDAVRIDRPQPDVAIMPHYSRLFYGYSPDQDLWWMDSSIEFYPVNHPVSWFNISDETSGHEFNWEYNKLNDEGELQWFVDTDPDQLDVTYTTDYSSAATVRNNFYNLPRLRARGPQGGISDYVTTKADFLQAGGTTEFESMIEGVPVYTKYTALPFDILTEGFGLHLEEDTELGFLSEPIFGRSVNTDAWWEHYCFPDGKRDDQYAYVVGFSNLVLPHDTAPLVVNGVSAAAIGIISDEAEFSVKIYAMTDEGVVIEQPIAEKTISGADVVKIPGYSTSGDFLVLNFPFDAPVILDANNTGYGYMVDVTGYHSDNVEYFAPIQSTVPNEYEWCLGFYHIKHSGFNDLTNEFSYVAFFKDGNGNDLYSSFAIGLDAHYPWLEMAAKENPFTVGNDGVSFKLHGYYEPKTYQVEAPEGVDVKLSGSRYITTVKVACPAGYTDDTVPVTFSAPGVSLSVDVPAKATSGIASATVDADTIADVYNAQGVCVLRNANADHLKALPKGLYIFGDKKVVIK